MSAPMDQLMADSDSPSQKDIQLARQHQQIDEELSMLEREASQLQRSLEEGARNHIRELKKIKEQRAREAALAEEKQKNNVLEDTTIQKLRTTNKILRRRLQQLEVEKQMLSQNTMSMIEANEKVEMALVKEQNSHQEIIVQNDRLKKEYMELQTMFRMNQQKKEERLSQLEFEKQSIAAYQKSTKKILKLIDKGIRGTWVAMKVNNVVQRVGLIGDFDDSSQTSSDNSSKTSRSSSSGSEFSSSTGSSSSFSDDSF